MGLKPDVHPEQATETFDQLWTFFEKFDKSEELRERIVRMDQVVGKFEQRVFKFTNDIGYNSDIYEANALAAQLHLDLNETRE